MCEIDAREIASGEISACNFDMRFFDHRRIAAPPVLYGPLTLKRGARKWRKTAAFCFVSNVLR
ncbi:MAG: hypothetical protein ACTHPD_09220 [Rhizomicrobium sp.]